MLVRVEEIAERLAPVRPDEPCGALFARFLTDPSLDIVPVVSTGAALGLISRARLFDAIAAGEAGVSSQTPISAFMLPDPVMAELGTPVALVAKLSAEASSTGLSDGVIVLKDGAYFGVLTPAAMLKTVALENTQRARAQKAGQKQVATIRAAARKMAQDRSRFLSFVGHEIRTPLTGILGIADILQDSLPDGESRKLARTISHSGQHLDRLLGDLLDLSRLESGKLPVDMGAFDLREFATEARELWSIRVTDRPVDLRISVATDALDRIQTDATRVRQILFNLVSNALKFTEKGYVSVELSTAEVAGQTRLVMQVSDTGCGISDADKSRLFEAFEQATPATASRHGGTGLGLAIAKGLVKRLGGAIDLADNPEGGTIFTVTLPVQPAAPRLATVSQPVRPRMRSLSLGRILLAEDHGISALVITRALSGAGWQVEAVSTGAEAIEKAQIHPYQAILTDLHMSGGDGLSVLQAVRNGDGPNCRVPILAVTADVSPESRKACEDSGFTDMIEKPIRPRALVARLADILMEAEPDAVSRHTA